MKQVISLLSPLTATYQFQYHLFANITIWLGPFNHFLHRDDQMMNLHVQLLRPNILLVKKCQPELTKLLASDKNFGRLNFRPTILFPTKIFTEWYFNRIFFKTDFLKSFLSPFYLRPNQPHIDQSLLISTTVILFSVYESKRRFHANFLWERNHLFYVDVKTKMCRVDIPTRSRQAKNVFFDDQILLFHPIFTFFQIRFLVSRSRSDCRDLSMRLRIFLPSSFPYSFLISSWWLIRESKSFSANFPTFWHRPQHFPLYQSKPITIPCVFLELEANLYQ